MSSKKDTSSASNASIKPGSGLSSTVVNASSRLTQHGSQAPNPSTASIARTSISPSSKKDPVVHFRTSTAVPRGQSMMPKTIAGSAASMRKPPSASMPPVSQSMAPPISMKGTQLNRAALSPGTKLNRDVISQGTKLNRDEIGQGTRLNRDDIAPGTKLNRDEAIIQPRTMAPPGTKSIFLNPHDITMASRQTQIDALPPKERDEQEEWAQDLIKRSGACPQGYDWNRKPGGYQCRGGGHGITDDMLAEGMGGMWALPTKNWAVKEGPYYPRDGEWYKSKP